MKRLLHVIRKDFYQISSKIESNKKYIDNVTPEIYKQGKPLHTFLTFMFIDAISDYINFDDIKTILDIGSRDCYQSEEFRTWFPESKIFAFEANPEQFSLCEKISKNNNINFIKKAVGDKNCTTKFFVTNSNPGASSLLKINPKNPRSSSWGFKKEYDVEMIRIDTWSKENNLLPDLLWIDVQGAEEMVLKGCGEILQNVKAIAVELGSNTNNGMYINGPTGEEVDNFLTSKGFLEIEHNPEKTSEINYDVNTGYEYDAIYVNKKWLNIK